MFVRGGGFEEVNLVGDLVSAVAKNTDGGGAGMEVFGGEKCFQEILGFIDPVESPGDPEGFEEVVFIENLKKR